MCIRDSHFAFTHIRFPVDDDSDDEWEAGFTYTGLPFGGESGLTLVYSEDADGVFIEWGNASLIDLRKSLS